MPSTEVALIPRYFVALERREREPGYRKAGVSRPVPPWPSLSGPLCATTTEVSRAKKSRLHATAGEENLKFLVDQPLTEALFLSIAFGTLR